MGGGAVWGTAAVLGGAGLPIPAHSSLKSSTFCSEPPNAPFDFCCKPNTAELHNPIIRTMETNQMGSTGKSLSSDNWSVSGPEAVAIVSTLKVSVASS